MKLTDLLRSCGACSEAIEWAGSRQADTRAWAACKQADWLLWIAARLGVDRKLVVLAACACARTALKYVPKGEERPLAAIETAERWAQGKATIGKVRSAVAAADASAADASAVAAVAAADASAAAASAVAAVAAAYAAKSRALARMSKLVRQRIPWRTVKAALDRKKPR